MSRLETLKPTSEKAAIERLIGVGVLVVVALCPLFVSELLGHLNPDPDSSYRASQPSASSSLAAYGGMISLAQAALYGIAAFALGNMVTRGRSKGSTSVCAPGSPLVLAIAITTAIGFVFGAVAAAAPGSTSS